MSEKPLSTPLLHTPSPAAHKLELLRQLFPQAVQTDPDGSVRVDAAQIQRALDPANAQGIRVEETGYELRWVGKQEAYHTAFARTDKIVAPVPADSKAWDSTGNLLIKGDNLDALKLLRQSYFGQVKLIYIDPPYNTKSDEFIYRDDFTARQTDILAQLGYSADNVEYIQNIYGARTHSGWLSFMYPRLLLAKDLLRDDGVIFISIDDNEQAQLKLLCDEVFGQENFIAEAIWEGANKNDARQIGTVHEYVIVYARNRDALPREWSLKKEGTEAVFAEVKRLQSVHGSDYAMASQALGSWFRSMKATPSFMLRRFRYIDQRGAYKEDDPTAPGGRKFNLINPRNGQTIPLRKNRGWSFDQDEFNRLVDEGRVSFIGESSVMVRRYLHETDALTPPSVYYQAARSASERLSKLMGGNVFDFPKDETVISKFIEMAAGSCKDDCITLDFFAGSGTTGEAVMRLNAEDGGQRQFILVQIPQPIDPKKQKEAHSFVTQTLGKPEATIFEITAERLRRAGDKINAAQRSQGKPEVDAGFRVYTLADDPHALVHRTPLDQATQADVAALQAAIATPQPEQRPVVLANLLLTEGLPLSTTLTPLTAGGVADALWQAQDTLLVLDAVPLDALVDLLRQRKAAGTPVHHVSVYAPWVHDDNFLQGVQTLLEAEGFSADRLRLRG